MNLRKTAVAAALLLALTTTACGSDSENDAKDSEPKTSESASEQTTEEESEAPEAESNDGEALETFVDASRDAVEAELERYADVYKDFSLEAEGSSTLVYRYTYANEMDVDQTKSQLEAQQSVLQETAKSAIFPDMIEAGVENPSVKWIYENPDGSEITTILVES